MTRNPTHAGWSLGIGVAIGVAIGAAFHNIGAWVAIGAGLGLLIPYFGQRKNDAPR